MVVRRQADRHIDSARAYDAEAGARPDGERIARGAHSQIFVCQRRTQPLWRAKSADGGAAAPLHRHGLVSRPPEKSPRACNNQVAIGCECRHASRTAAVNRAPQGAEIPQLKTAKASDREQSAVRADRDVVQVAKRVFGAPTSG